MLIETGYIACGKQIIDLDFPEDAIIGCIVRGNNTIVPNGRTEIHAGDKLMIFTNMGSKDRALSHLIGSGYQ
ncbi:TrkA C-terminal domain-containing protein [Alicyclobacillus macrosporangiidus]|uniref:TrkA C-terminal domain-containing protein n=1 Tax=Alicyclobacillus macrosporangiidus TaxID=392015 RepID=UPI0026F31419|nr:TrkA C-terminal domain-containing protein [Alicyclobacillus macrosporangiidus]